MTDVVFWACVILYFVGTGIDFFSSLGFEYTGTYEGNKYLRDKDGFFTEKKYLIFAFVALIIPMFIYFYDREWGWVSGFVLLFIGFLRGLVGYKNFKNRPERRKQQIAILEAAAKDEPYPLTLRGYQGKRWFALRFGAFYTDITDYDLAQASIKRKIDALAREPRDKWLDPRTHDKIQEQVS